MNIKSHTYKPGDAVVESFAGTEIECHIVSVNTEGKVLLSEETGVTRGSHLNHLRPREENEKNTSN